VTAGDVPTRGPPPNMDVRVKDIYDKETKKGRRCSEGKIQGKRTEGVQLRKPLQTGGTPVKQEKKKPGQRRSVEKKTKLVRATAKKSVQGPGIAKKKTEENAPGWL